MEKFYLEEPSLKRQDEAFHYIIEHEMYGSKFYGTGGMANYKNNYKFWLYRIEQDAKCVPSEERVPCKTYFLIRDNDNRIIGMINIRLVLNERFRIKGGHIGYGIRPTERNKGYNKINLYLGLEICDQYNIEKALLDARLDNPGSWKTMEALGGKRIKEYILDNEELVKYEINVKESLEKYKDVYGKYLIKKR